MKYIIYQTMNLVNNKIYIGVHQNIKNEFDGYIGNGVYINKPSTYMKPRTSFQYAVKKYGVKNFKRITLYEYNSMEEAYAMEEIVVNQEFIKMSNNYNMTIGGKGGYDHPQPIYQFDKNGVLINTYENANVLAESYATTVNSVYTAIQFKESFRNTFLSFKSIINRNDYSVGNCPKIIYVYNKDGKLLQAFNSETEASKQLNIKRTDISNALKYYTLINKQYYFSETLYDEFKVPARKSLRGKSFYVYNTSGYLIKQCCNAEELRNYFKLKSWTLLSRKINYEDGYYKEFRILTEKHEKIESFTPKQQNKPVLVYDVNNNFIGEFKSEREAARQLNCKMSQINRVLRGVAHTHKGYIFKWKVNDIV